MLSMDSRDVLGNVVYLSMHAIKSGQGAVNQKDNCRRLVDRLKLLLPLFEEVKGEALGNQLAAAAMFERLELALLKAKELADRCSLPWNKLYMVTHAMPMVTQFNDVTAELLRCIIALPLVCLHASESIRSQIARINGEYRSVRYSVDAATRRAGSEVDLLLMEQRKGVRCNHEVLLRLADQLGLQSQGALAGERASLERARAAARVDNDREEEELVGQTLSLLALMEAEVKTDRRLAGRTRAESVSSRPTSPIPPKEYCCFLSLELMADPVICASGQTFERSFIERWMQQGNSSCPITKQMLSHTSLMPNTAVKASIASWCRANGLPLPQARKLPANATIRGPGLVDLHSWLADKAGKAEKPAAAAAGAAGRPRASRRTVRAVHFDTNSNSGSGTAESLPATTMALAPTLPVPADTEQASVEEELMVRVSDLHNDPNAAVMPTAITRQGTGSSSRSESSSPATSSEHPLPSSSSLPLIPPPLLASGSSSPASVDSVHSSQLSGSSTPQADVFPTRTHPVHDDKAEEEEEKESAPAAGMAGVARCASDLGPPTSRLKVAGVARSTRSEQEEEEEVEASPRWHSQPSSSGRSGRSVDSWSRPPGSPAASLSSSAAMSTSRYCGSPAPSMSSEYSESSTPRFSAPRASLDRCPSNASLGSQDSAAGAAGVAGGSRRSSGGEGDVTLAEGEEEELLLLVSRVTYGTSEEKCEAAQCMRQLSKGSHRHRVNLGRLGAVKPLVGLLAAPEDNLVESAAFALLNLSIADLNKEEIVARGSIGLLVRLLRSGGSDKVREAVVAVLFSLSLTDDNKLAIAAGGAVPGLVDVLVTGTKRAKQDVMSALYNLSLMGQNKGVLVEGGAIKPVLYIARKGINVFGTMMVEKAAAILSNLSWVPEGRHGIAATNGIPVLCQLVEHGSPKAKENATACLLRLCVGSKSHRALIYKEDVIVPLMMLGRDGTERAKAKAKALLQQFNN